MGIFQWWYGAGWLGHVQRSYVGMLRLADTFSMGLLIKTLFAPYRQIAAGRVQGPLPVQLSAFFDRLFSRVIGAVIRSVLLLVGLIALMARALIMLLSVVIWTLLPLTPFIGLALWLGGVAL